MSNSTSKSIFGTDDWQLGEGHIAGSHHIIRMRATLPSSADQELFSRLLIISWHYEHDESGMPESETHKRMQKFEDAVEAGTELRGVAFQALSMTGGGKKEWRYYAADSDAFMESLNKDLVGHEAYPLDIQSFLDPEWNSLREFQG